MDLLPLFLIPAAFLIVVALGKGRDAAKQAAEYDEMVENWSWPERQAGPVGRTRLP